MPTGPNKAVAFNSFMFYSLYDLAAEIYKGSKNMEGWKLLRWSQPITV